MSFSNNKITPVATGILLALNCNISSAEIVLNFANSTVAGVQGVDFNYSVCTAIADKAGREYRMCDPSNTKLGGGNPLKKDTINGTEIWTFDDSGTMTDVTNTGVTAGLDSSLPGYVPLPTGDASGGPATDQGAGFFGNQFAFLAPSLNSEAGTFYGEASIVINSDENTFTVFFPVLEAQWGNTVFPLGQVNNKGVTLFGTFTSQPITGASTTTFDFSMWGEHTIQQAEDPGSAGFSDWTGQWYYVGSGEAANSAFFPPASPFPESGNLNPTAGGPGDGNNSNDGRVSLSEIIADSNIGVDEGTDKENGITNQCSGGCFDFTNDSLSGSNSVVVLALAAPIPTNPVYRKFNSTLGWHDFDTSTGDTVESGSADETPAIGTSVSCVGTVFTTGLTSGDRCVRLTIADGGTNDDDGAANGTVVDPGGVASAPPAQEDNTIPGQSLSDAPGCSISNTPVNASNHAEWWIVAAFLSLIGLRRKLKQD